MHASIIGLLFILLIGQLHVSVMVHIGRGGHRLQVDQAPSLGGVRIQDIVIVFSVDWAEVILLLEIVDEEVLEALQSSPIWSIVLLHEKLFLLVLICLDVGELRRVNWLLDSYGGLVGGLIYLLMLVEPPHYLFLRVSLHVLGVLGAIQLPKVYSLRIHACHGSVEHHHTIIGDVTLIRGCGSANQCVL